MNISAPKIDFAVGGQAVIEGVMMRSPNYVTVAVRKNKGDIKVKDQDFQGIAARVKLFGKPLIRGVVNLFEMMIVGMKMLNFSASESLDEEIEDVDVDNDSTMGKLGTILSFGLSVVFAMGMSLFMFKFLPLWLTDYLSSQFQILNQNYLFFNLVDGVIKTVFFVAYIGILGLTPSIYRVFQYHGAEHKSIYTYERGLELTPENAKKQTRFHPRCGTSFILVVFLISIMVYTFVPRQETFLLTFATRVLFLPLIAGIGYEFLKWSAKHQDSRFVRAITAPGLWFQRLTTKEPDLEQLEVALTALKKALELEESQNPNLGKVAVDVA